MAYQCLSCEEQGYEDEDSQVPTPAHLCDFHEEHGARIKREQEGRREVIDISTRKPAGQGVTLEELVERVRSATSPVQMGLALQEILEMTDLPVREVSQMFDKSDMWAYQNIYLARLSKPIQQMVEDKHIQLGIAREIGRAVPAEEQMEMVRAVRKMSVVNGKKHIKEWLRQRDGSEESEEKEVETDEEALMRSSQEVQEAFQMDEEASVPSLPQSKIQRNRAPGSSRRKKSAREEDRVSQDTVVVFLRALGDADRSLSTLIDIPYSTLRNAFSDPMDLEMAKRHLLTSSYRLNEVLELLEAMERSRR